MQAGGVHCFLINSRTGTSPCHVDPMNSMRNGRSAGCLCLLLDGRLARVQISQYCWAVLSGAGPSLGRQPSAVSANRARREMAVPCLKRPRESRAAEYATRVAFASREPRGGLANQEQFSPL
eukprot:scaffold109390_cov63-Phaeocystis_antarctica.AAC.1